MVGGVHPIAYVLSCSQQFFETEQILQQLLCHLFDNRPHATRRQGPNVVDSRSASDDVLHEKQAVHRSQVN